MLKRLIKHCCAFVLKLSFSFRYRFKVFNKKILSDPKYQEKPVLVLCNHPSEIDALFILALAGVRLNLHPVVVENFYHYPGAKFFMDLVGAIPVPDIDMAVSDVKLKQAEEYHAKAVDVLKRNQGILIFPSGTLKRKPAERIGGRSGVPRLIQDVDDVEVILVRLTGLWGSAFSTAQWGHTPDFWKQVFRGFKTALKNFLFFAPRRKIYVEFEEAGADFPRKGDKIKINTYLENWFNQYYVKDGERVAEEPLNLVRESFWSSKLPKVKSATGRNDALEGMQVPRDIRTNILCKLSEMSAVPVGKIKDEQDLIYDLGLDSIDKTQIFTFLDDQYEIDQALIPGDLVTVNDLFAAALKLKEPMQKSAQVDKSELKKSWPKEKRKAVSHTPKGETIIEAFLNTSKAMGKLAACADATSGVLSYKRMRLAVVILAREIQKIEGKYVGIMLPSSCGVAILYLATLLAKKVPVMLNWTLGPLFMDHAVNLLEIKAILTSRKFIQKMQYLDIGEALNRLVYIEDLRAGLSKGDKLRGALTAMKSTKSILKSFQADTITGDDVGAILFTSGTTGMPKAAQLSHLNILSNQESCMEKVDLHPDDILFSVLPFFHVFGLVMTGLLPLIFGYRAYYFPDPTDGAGMGNQIMIWKATILMMAPTFYDNLFKSCTFRQLRSLRLFISGAEKASNQLMDTIKSFSSHRGHGTSRSPGEVYFIEGYGLTETSPVISMNLPAVKAKGVGQVLDNLDVVIIDPESTEILNIGQTGEICVSGPSVFLGYLKSKENPFITLQGKKYLRTGDMGQLDKNRYIVLGGRIKRFVKKAGEMLSLSIMEDELFNRAIEKKIIPSDWNHRPFVIMANEDVMGTPKLILFSEVRIDVDVVNEIFREAGFSRLFKVNEVQVINEIPMLSSGKVSLGKLGEMVKEMYPTPIDLPS